MVHGRADEKSFEKAMDTVLDAAINLFEGGSPIYSTVSEYLGLLECHVFDLKHAINARDNREITVKVVTIARDTIWALVNDGSIDKKKVKGRMAVLNKTLADFALSDLANDWFEKRTGIRPDKGHWDTVESRIDKNLLAVINDIGLDLCACPDCEFAIVEIPLGVEVTLERDEEGLEYFAEKHRTWQ
jgi:hypothetical protein